MSLTQVEYAPPVYDVVLRLVPHFKSVLNIHLDDLAAILITHIGENDKLSARLSKWAIELLDVDFNSESEEMVVTIIGEKIHKLVKKILLDPITLNTYQNPIRFQDWVLENSVLNYLDEFDGTPIRKPVQFPEHLFAKKMLSWSKNLIEASLNPQSLSQQSHEITPYWKQNLCLEEFSRSLHGPAQEIIKIFCCQMSQKAIRVRNLKNETNTYRAKMIHCEQIKRESENLVAFLERSLRVQQSQDENRIKQAFTGIEKAHQEAVNQLQIQIENRRQSEDSIHAAHSAAMECLEKRLIRALQEKRTLQEDLITVSEEQKRNFSQICQLQFELQRQASDLQELRNRSRKRICSIQ